MEAINEKLILIGFKDFVHLDKNKRDGMERKVFNSFFNGDWISITLIKQGEEWIVDKLDDNGVIQKMLAINKEIKVEDVILFFKNFYFSDSISALL